MGEKECKAVKSWKEALATNSIMKIFKYGATTALHTDASQEGYGAVLLQKDSEDKELHPVYYYSRKTTDTKENSSYVLEVLAIIQFNKKFQMYLLG